jgi:hypothetical protein
MRQLLFLAILALIGRPVAAQSTATLRGIDVYRSSILTPLEVHKRFDERLRNYVSNRNAPLRANQEKAEALRVEMEKEASVIPGIYWVQLHVSEYFTSVDHALYVVFDVVDKADISRMAFSPSPKAHLSDPGGLLRAWHSYVTAGEVLSRRGEMPLDRPDCPGFYCLWGGKPELDQPQLAFVEGARNRGEELRRVLRADADGEQRAAALFILSYSTSGVDVINVCQAGLMDADARVRGAALQVLADIANHNPEIIIPLERVLPRLDDPSAAVRGKAMGLLVPLVERTAYNQTIMKSAPRIATLMKLSQPESRDLAFTVLGLLSKKNFDRSDFASWDAWAQSAVAPPPAIR